MRAHPSERFVTMLLLCGDGPVNPSRALFHVVSCCFMHIYVHSHVVSCTYHVVSASEHFDTLLHIGHVCGLSYA